MPPKRSALSRSTAQARRKKIARASETPEQRQIRLETARVHAAKVRSSETDAQREARLKAARIRVAKNRRKKGDNRRKATQRMQDFPNQLSMFHNVYYPEDPRYHSCKNVDNENGNYFGQEWVTTIETSDETTQNQEILYSSLSVVKTESEEISEETLQNYEIYHNIQTEPEETSTGTVENYEIHHNIQTAVKTEPEDSAVSEIVQNDESRQNSLHAVKTEPVDETVENDEMHQNGLIAMQTEQDDMLVNEDLVKSPSDEYKMDHPSASSSSIVTCKKEDMTDNNLEEENLTEEQWISQQEPCQERIQTDYSTSSIVSKAKKGKAGPSLDTPVVNESLETSSTQSDAYPNMNSVNQCEIPSFNASALHKYFKNRNQGVRLKRREVSLIEQKLIVDLRKEGKSFREIGETIGRTHSCIQRVLKSHDPKGILSAPVGRPSKLNSDELQILINIVTQNPRITAPEIVEMIQQKFGKKIHVDTVRKTLRKYSHRNS